MRWWTAALAIPALAQISDSQWRLISAPPGLPTSAVFLRFTGRQLAFKGCNSHSGAYETDGNRRLLTPQMASTLMACLDPQRMELDRRLAKTLERATYRINKDRLTIQGESGDAWTFRREAAPE